MKIRNSKILLSIILASVMADASFAAGAPDISGKYKSSGPIEITSDSLQVLQQQHKAIFTGHVLAVQGDVHIKSEKMTVFYKAAPESKDKKDAAASKESAMTAAVGEKNSIEKIIVEKNVFLTTPQETARGANGLYDVEHNKIYLNDNVVLTRDKNVLKGNKLVYDFATGKSELSSSGTGKSGQRVKALFISGDDKKTKK